MPGTAGLNLRAIVKWMRLSIGAAVTLESMALRCTLRMFTAVCLPTFSDASLGKRPHQTDKGKRAHQNSELPNQPHQNSDQPVPELR
jgi:hypothetical protein